MVIIGDDRVHPDSDTVLWVNARVGHLLTGCAPEFGSWSWCQLDDTDPAFWLAILHAAMRQWTTTIAGEVPAELIDREINRRMADASRSLHSADPRLWRRVTTDRMCRRPQGRARSVYEAPEPTEAA